MDAVVLIYATAPTTQDAEAIGRALVEERLAACASVIPGMRSVYRWKDAVETADEAVLIIKTTAAKAGAAVARLAALHPYDTPAAATLAVDEATSHAPFLAWVRAETEGR